MKKNEIEKLARERYPRQSGYALDKYVGMYSKCIRWKKKFPDTWCSFVMAIDDEIRSPGMKQAIADFMYNPLNSSE